MERCVVYARCSDPKQAERDLSIPAQLDEARRWAAGHRFEVVQEYIEPGESARTADRPVFQQMIADARRRSRRFDTILVWKFSRFARSREDSVIYKSLLERHGVRLVSLNEPVEDTPAGKMYEGLMELVDEFYSANLAQDTLRGMRKNASMGHHNGGTTPTGYRVKKTGEGLAVRGVFEPDEQFAPLVRRIFERALAGEGSKTIAEGLNMDGHRTTRGKAWSKQGVLNILRNEVYTGVRIWGKANRSKANKTEEPIRVAGAHEALVTIEDFARVQLMLKERSPKRVHPRRLGQRYLLSGLLYCARCGGRFIGHAAKSGKVLYYGCQTKLKSGKSSCDAKLLNAKRTEQTVAQELTRLVLTPEHLAELVHLVNDELESKGAVAEDELASVQSLVAEAKRTLQRNFDALDKGVLGLDILGPRIRHWKARCDELEAREASLRAQAEGPRSLLVGEDTIVAYVEGMRDLLARGNVDQRRAFLRAWIRRIDADGDRLTIHYTFPHIPGTPGDNPAGDGRNPGSGGRNPGSGGNSGGGNGRARTKKAEPRWSPTVLPMVNVGSP